MCGQWLNSVRTGMEVTSVDMTGMEVNGMGMIRRVQGSGNYVTGDAHRAIRQICTMMLALGTITKKDVCEFRRVLEKSACLLLSEKGVPADERRQFEEILAAMESADEKTLTSL